MECKLIYLNFFSSYRPEIQIDCKFLNLKIDKQLFSNMAVLWIYNVLCSTI